MSSPANDIARQPAADALDAYTTRGDQTTKRVNFKAEEFVHSRDTIYIHAPAEHQQAVGLGAAITGAPQPAATCPAGRSRW